MLQLFPSSLRAVGTYTKEFQPQFASSRRFDVRGIECSINYTAEGSASSTLDFKLQYWDGNEWKDITGASVAQMTAVADTDLTIHPDLTASANRIVKLPLFEVMRAVAVVGTNTVTFSVQMDALP